LTMFGSGAIAIIAMILPGISGSYILVILWQYQQVLSNVVDFVGGNWSALIPLMIFMFGAIVWLLGFAKVLHWIKAKWHDQMVVVLMWFILWALNKVWPWKEVVETYIDRHGEIQPLIEKNIIPIWSNEILIWILFCLVGFGIVILIDFLTQYRKK
jgi:putative membrane protein